MKRFSSSYHMNDAIGLNEHRSIWEYCVRKYAFFFFFVMHARSDDQYCIKSSGLIELHAVQTF